MSNAKMILAIVLFGAASALANPPSVDPRIGTLEEPLIRIFFKK